MRDSYTEREPSVSGVSPEMDKLAYAVIGAAIEVHRILGPGLLEAHYEKAMEREMTLRGISFVRQAPFDIVYKKTVIGEGRIDFLIDGRLIVELKSVDALAPIHRSQAITYLQETKLTLALLINFNVAILRDGVKRVIHTL